MEKINVEKLTELGIFEIRNLAREVGVYSPTTLKKQELIDKIMKVIEGKEEPYIKTTKQGRPPKNISSINNLVDVIVPSKIFENKKTTSNNKSYFCDLNESLNVNISGSNETYFKNIIKVYDNNEYALAFLSDIKEEKDKVVFITKSQVDFYKLKTGDEISGKFTFISEDKPFILKEIYSINEVGFSKEYERKEDFNNLVAFAPSEKLKMSVYKINDEIYENIDLFTPIAKGQRLLLNSCSFNNMLNYQILNRLTTSVNNLTGLAILIDEMPENYYEVKNNTRLDVSSNNYSQNANFKLELDVKIEKLKRSVENGQDVLLFVNDIAKFKNYLVNLFILEDNSEESSKIFAEEYIKNIILLGKYTKDIGSITVVCGATNIQKNIELESKFMNLFNNILSYNKSGFEYKLDVQNSSIYNIENILTKSELKKLIEISKI